MNAEDLTYEELAALMEAKRAEQPEVGTVTVRGRTIRTYPHKLRQWRVFKLIGELDDEDVSEFVKAEKACELLEIITDVKADDIIEELGGDEADAFDVLQLVLEIIQAVAPKNS